MRFEGFSRELPVFLAELNENNTKDWFDANRSRYEALLAEPAKDFVAALGERLGGLTPPLQAEPKVNGSIRRINRDIRFSKDKTPYNTHLHLVFWHGDHPNRAPGVHVVLAHDHFGYGAGHWAFEPDQLKRYRADVAADGGAGVSAAVQAVERKGVKLTEPALARVPAGIDKTAAWADWTRHKGLVVMSGNQAYPNELFSDAAADQVFKLCEDMAPLMRYLSERIFSLHS